MKLLVIRMSSMGDVALTLPVLRSVLDRYPELTITLVTRKQFLPFFQAIPRLGCVTADVKGVHRGIPGLFRLFREIKKEHAPDALLDLHDVLRSRILSFFFKRSGSPVFRIDKGRKEKKRLTAKTGKIFAPLAHTVTRYLRVFEEAGFPADLSARSDWFSPGTSPETFLRTATLLPKSGTWIGIAPFAKHPEKRWPLEKMEEVIGNLERGSSTLFLFGGGEKETALLNGLKENHSRAIIVAGRLSLAEELGLIRQLDLMITMDSANMHLAALSGIPVVSIWGATHPFAGFGPLGHNDPLIVQIPHAQLSCRPCSVFGNKPCFRGDHACMGWLSPDEVLKVVVNALSAKSS